MSTSSTTAHGVPVITTDASGIGIGGFFEEESFTGYYPEDYERPHISVGEAQAALVALRRFGPMLVAGRNKDARVLFRIDNTQAVAAFNKGYSPNPLLDAVAREFVEFAARLGLDCACIHIAGELNERAESEQLLEPLAVAERIVG